MNRPAMVSMRRFAYCITQVAGEMARGAKDNLNNVNRNKSVEIEVYKELSEISRDNGSAIMLVSIDICEQ